MDWIIRAGECGGNLQQPERFCCRPGRRWQSEFQAESDAARIDVDLNIVDGRELHIFPFRAQEHVRQNADIHAKARGDAVSDGV